MASLVPVLMCWRQTKFGTTMMSFCSQSKVWPPISDLPLPSITTMKVPQVSRLGSVSSPGRMSCAW